MSRIGKLPIALRKDVQVRVGEGELHVKGPKGELVQAFDPTAVSVEVVDGQLRVVRLGDDRGRRSKHGLYRALFANMVRGVTDGYEQALVITGVGYRAEVKGKNLELFVGFPGAKTLKIPDGIKVAVDKNTRIVLQSADKQRLGQFAAEIRRVRPPEPYKGKGIRLEGETIRRKAGKTAK